MPTNESTATTTTGVFSRLPYIRFVDSHSHKRADRLIWLKTYSIAYRWLAATVTLLPLAAFEVNLFRSQREHQLIKIVFHAKWQKLIWSTRHSTFHMRPAIRAPNAHTHTNDQCSGWKTRIEAKNDSALPSVCNGHGERAECKQIEKETGDLEQKRPHPLRDGNACASWTVQRWPRWIS